MPLKNIKTHEERVQARTCTLIGAFWVCEIQFSENRETANSFPIRFYNYGTKLYHMQVAGLNVV